MPMDILTLLPSPLSLRKGSQPQKLRGIIFRAVKHSAEQPYPFGYLCKSMKKLFFGAIQDISGKTEAICHMHIKATRRITFKAYPRQLLEMDIIQQRCDPLNFRDS